MPVNLESPEHRTLPSFPDRCPYKPTFTFSLKTVSCVMNTS